MRTYYGQPYTPYVYIIQSKVTKQYYLGCQTRQGRTGHCAHPSQLLTVYFTSSRIVKEMVQRDGKDSFQITTIIPCSSIEEAHKWEALFLANINPSKDPNWLNVRTPSKNFYPKSGPENHRYGKKLTEEHKAAISASRTGFRVSQRVKDYWSKIMSGVEKPQSQTDKMSAAAKGKLKSAEHKENLSKAVKPEKHLNGIHVTKPDGSYMFAPKIGQFAREHGLSQGCITAVCRGRCIQHKGYKFRYA